MRLSSRLRHPPKVPRVEKPRAEGQFHLADGRRLGYAEFGNAAGPVVLWFHSTLGARRQFPMIGRRAAEKLGLRVIILERPGTGWSDSHRYASVSDWVADIAQVADALDVEQARRRRSYPVVALTLWPAARWPRWSLGWLPWPS